MIYLLYAYNIFNKCIYEYIEEKAICAHFQIITSTSSHNYNYNVCIPHLIKFIYIKVVANIH